MTSILAIAYGDMCSFEPGDPVLRKAFAITERAANTMGPSDQIREFFPILKTLWPVKREKYLKVRQDFGDFYGGLLDQFKSQYSDQDCFVKDIVALDQLTDLQIRNFIGIFVGAGSDTTTSTLEWLIAFLANNLDVQEKAYSEIIDSVGLNRLPGSQDGKVILCRSWSHFFNFHTIAYIFVESRLPYIQCIILETLRLRPPAPVAIPHSTTQDDAYRNWLIPKDTIVVMNLYAVHNDPIRFPQPTLFQPDRHFDYVLNQSKKFGQTVEDRPHLSFSTGRRVCVGIHLAERNLFMAVSMLLACFKFERLTDQLIDTETARDVRAPTWTPMHYRIRLVPRHEGVRHLF